MNNLRKLAIVPALNEEGSIESVLEELHRHAPDFDVLVVDDGSIDATRAARPSAAGANVIRHPFNLGIGGAVQSGFKYARRHGYDVAVQVDGDGQHDPAYLASMLSTLHTDDEADMVCGTRFRGKAGYEVPRARRAGMRVFRLLLSTIVGQRITDPTSGFRMTNRRGIELFARDYPHDYPEVEAILMLHAHKLQLHEIPVRDARARQRPLLDPPGSQRLLHGARAAGDLRRALPPHAGPGAGRAPLARPPRGELVGMSTKLQIVAIVVSSGLLLVVLELVRRRRLRERYALLWIVSGLVLLLLSAWATCSTSSRACSGCTPRPTRCSRSPSASCCCCCSTSR